MYLLDYNFDHLHPANDAEGIQHSFDYIKNGIEVQATRRIFYGVPIDNFENNQIKELESHVRQKGITLPREWTDRETLKYLYAAKFDHEKATKLILNCKEWRSNPISRTLTKEVLALLEDGTVYVYGKDKQLRPIMIFDFGKLDLNKVDILKFNAAVTIILDIISSYCYYPGKVENAIVIIDTRNLAINQLPISAIKSCAEIVNSCFPCNLFKAFVIGPPLLLRMSWKLISGLMETETAEKFELLPIEDLKKLQQFIHPSQLEQKFDGIAPDLIKFWPPVSSFGRKSETNFQDKSIHGIKAQHLESSVINGQPIPVSRSRFEFNNLDSNNLKQNFNQTNERYTSAGRLEPTKDQYFSFTDQAFNSKPQRASHGLSHSPTKIKKDADEEFIRDMIYSKIKPTPPANMSFSHPNLQSLHALENKQTENYRENLNYHSREVPQEKTKKSALPNTLGIIKEDFLDTLGEKRTQEKRLDDQINKQLGITSNQNPSNKFFADKASNPYNDAGRLDQAYQRIHEKQESKPQSSKNGSRSQINQEIMEMIVNDHQTLTQTKKTNVKSGLNRQLSNQSIPNELIGKQEDIGDKIAQRQTIGVRMKEYVDNTYISQRSPTYKSGTAEPSTLYQSYPNYAPVSPNSLGKVQKQASLKDKTNEFTSEYLRLSEAAEPLRKSRQPQRENSEAFLDMPVELNGSVRSAYQYTQNEPNRSSKNDHPPRPDDEWSPDRVRRELSRPYQEESDDETNFCGVCVSKRHRKKYVPEY